MRKQLRLCFDIDNTITFWDNGRDYKKFKPDMVMVNRINELYDQGHYIFLYTSRGMTSVGPDRIDAEITPDLLYNLESIGLKYHEIITHKPVYDFIIDDKAIDVHEFLKESNIETRKPRGLYELR